MMAELTKDQFLARCENAWNMGLCTPERLLLMERWVDFVLRFEGGQMNYVADFLEAEARRTEHFSNSKTLASDGDGYGLQCLAAVLNHPCQACGEDPKAWHTRTAFCQHKSATRVEAK